MSLKHTVIASVLMLVSLAGLRYFSHSEEIHPNKAFSTFPRQIGIWEGKEQFFDQKVYEVLGVSDSFLANYISPEGKSVNLYIGFYQSQREGELIHSPKNCMPGAGWNISRSTIEELETPGFHSGKIRVIKLILEKGQHKQVMLYWFHARGRIISSEYMQKIYLVIDSMTRHRTDESFVRLISYGDEAEALNTLKEFAKQLMPILHEYIPS